MTDCLVTKGRSDFTVLVVTTTFVSVYSDLLSLWLQCLRKKEKMQTQAKGRKCTFLLLKLSRLGIWFVQVFAALPHLFSFGQETSMW